MKPDGGGREHGQGAGAPGAHMVAKAKPDGCTLMTGNIGTQAINPSPYRKLPCNPDPPLRRSRW